MNRIAVESTTLATIGHESVSGILQLEFHSCGVYRYFGVPHSVYKALLAASSKGKYFNRVIRGCFPHAPASNGGRGEA